jgi:fructokinase
MKYKIGIDVGGTKSEAVLLAEDRKELYRKRAPTPQKQGYQAILDVLNALCREAVGHIPEEEDYTIGIGIPGTINSETGLVQNANTTCLIDMPFQKDIENLLGRQVMMENDANCFTLAESLWGAAKGYGLVFGIIMGTGCGGGICIDSKVRQGGHSIAGEWGHFSVDPLGAKCYCGNPGCIETKISGSGVEAAYFKKFGINLKMDEIVLGFRKGDPPCTEVFNQFLDDFGRCLGGLISMLDPDAVVIGGGLSKIEELYVLGVEHVCKYAFHRHVKTPILENKLGDSSGVLGAAWIGV